MLTSISGEVDEAKLSYILRDFDLDGLNQRKAKIEEITKTLQQKYGEDRIIVDIKDSYYNMKEKIEPVMYIIDLAKKAMKDADIDDNMLALKSMEALEKVAQGKSTKLVLPSDAVSFLGTFKGIKEVMKDDDDIKININNKEESQE